MSTGPAQFRSATFKAPVMARSRYSSQSEAERREVLKKYGPPMAIIGAAGDAATALYVRASMEKVHDRVEMSVKKLIDQFRADKDLALLVRSSNAAGAAMTSEQVDRLAGALQKDLGLDEVTTEFFGNLFVILDG